MEQGNIVWRSAAEHKIVRWPISRNFTPVHRPLFSAQRVFGVWRSTVLRWLERYVKRLPTLAETLD